MSSRINGSAIRLSIAKWEDLWIAEGAATYFEVLWPNRNDLAAFDAEMREHLRLRRGERDRTGGGRRA